MDEDLKIIDDLHRGDEYAYKKLFLKYYSPLCEFSSQFLSDSDAEEVVQDFMLFIWENHKNLLITTSLKSDLLLPSKPFIERNQTNQFIPTTSQQMYEKLGEQSKTLISI